MYKLKANEANDVEYVTPAGSDFVRSSMPEGQAIGIVEAAKKVEDSDKFDGFNICVNGGEYYFNGKLVAEKAEPKKTTSKKK